VPHPTSAYGRSKLGGEIATLAAKDDIEVIVVRPPVVYGPRDRGLLPFYRLVSRNLMPLFGDGSRRISWIHARDLAVALLQVAKQGAASGSIFSVCDEGSYSWSDLARLLGEALNRRPITVPIPPPLFSFAGSIAGIAGKVFPKPLPLTPDRVREMGHPFWICSNDRITGALGWRPAIEARDGIAETVRWYRERHWI
jgi:nucleoside-diphosphate-sugar epimerase